MRVRANSTRAWVSLRALGAPGLLKELRALHAADRTTAVDDNPRGAAVAQVFDAYLDPRQRDTDEIEEVCRREIRRRLTRAD